MNKTFIVKIILYINILIFLLWILFGQSDQNFMVENFLISWTQILKGRYWTLLTSVFSHAMFFHLFLNMYILYGFGTLVEKALGSKRFLFFYLVAGILASLCHAIVSAYLLGEPETFALGASGAVSGVIVLFSLLFPREKIFIFGLIPIPAIWGMLLVIGLDLWGLIFQSTGGDLPIGYGAHLGGALIGIIYFFSFKNHRIKKQPSEESCFL